MELGNNNTLSTINHESAAVCHERNLPHVNALLFGASLFAKLERDIKRRTVSFGLTDSFQGSKFWIAYFVKHEIESHFLVVALNRKNLLENSLEADILALRGEDILLQEILIGPKLNFNQVRWLGDFVDLAKVGALGHKARWGDYEMAGRGGVERGSTKHQISKIRPPARTSTISVWK